VFGGFYARRRSVMLLRDNNNTVVFVSSTSTITPVKKTSVGRPAAGSSAQGSEAIAGLRHSMDEQEYVCKVGRAG
jgi:hypothetical protein